MTVDANKSVSIIIPTHNRIGYLKEALESALRQSYKNIEIIVCDNASTDDTNLYMAEQNDKRIKYIRHEKPVDYIFNFNSWTDVSTADFVCYLTDDDKLEPTFIEKCVNELLNDTSTRLVKTGSFIINEKSEVVGEYLPFKDSISTGAQFIFDRINPRYSEFSMLCGCMFRKADFLKIGGVLSPGEPASHAADDYLWFRMVLLDGNVKYINERLWCYRAHSSNMAVVSSLSEFRKFCNTFVPKIITLLEEHNNIIDKNILDYVKYEYEENLIKNRILYELGRNRKRSFLKTLNYLKINRKIIAEYYGIKRIFYEIILRLLLIARSR